MNACIVQRKKSLFSAKSAENRYCFYRKIAEDRNVPIEKLPRTGMSVLRFDGIDLHKCPCYEGMRLHNYHQFADLAAEFGFDRVIVYP